MRQQPTRVIDLTLDQLLDAVEDRVRAIMSEPDKRQTPQASQAPKRYVYGLRGLQQLLGCSKTTASRIKTSGKIDAATTQIGALLIFDADMTIEIINSHNHQPKPQRPKRK